MMLMCDQLIEIWETFLMQLDTDDGDAFVLPAGIVASPDAEVRPSSEDRPTTAESETPSMRAAAEATRDAEE